MEDKTTHIAFSDESNYNNPLYASISIISIEKSLVDKLNKDLLLILQDSNIKEFSWKWLRSGKQRHCAIKLINNLFKVIKEGKFRIDTLIWSVEERKKKFPENDVLMLKKMYHHLFKNVLMLRWPPNTNWGLFPDRHSAINWKKQEEILGYCMSEREFLIHEIPSLENPLGQIADLFAGMGAFSYTHRNKLLLNKKQTKLFGGKNNLSNSEKEKIELCNHLKKLCNLQDQEILYSKGFETKDPSFFINFWFFKFKDFGKNTSLKKWF